MSELKEDLDRALRSVTFGEAPVDRAMRDGRRRRNRRRLTVLAGAAAIVAVAGSYPALTRNAASTTPSPATGRTHTPSPSHTASPHRDPVITSGPPADTIHSGMIARGTIGGAQWSVAISGGGGVRDQACFSAFAGADTGPAAHSAGQVLESCAPNAADLATYSAPDPAGFTAGIGTATGGTATYVAALGTVAPDVTYLTLDFADGQQLKLVPVSYLGRRFVAWLAPTSMTVTRLTAHLGTAHAANGQIETAVPYQAPGRLPVFSLWLKPGQPVPPRASGAIGGGTKDGRVWSVTADEGPWGTCFAYSFGGSDCTSSPGSGTTQIIATVSWGGDLSSTVAVGSAAPGVKKVVVTLSNHSTVVLPPVTVGNENLFAFRYGKGVSPTGWTAYDANGREVGHGPVTH
jgi:hypothetical protein